MKKGVNLLITASVVLSACSGSAVIEAEKLKEASAAGSKSPSPQLPNPVPSEAPVPIAPEWFYLVPDEIKELYFSREDWGRNGHIVIPNLDNYPIQPFVIVSQPRDNPGFVSSAFEVITRFTFFDQGLLRNYNIEEDHIDIPLALLIHNTNLLASDLHNVDLEEGSPFYMYIVKNEGVEVYEIYKKETYEVRTTKIDERTSTYEYRMLGVNHWESDLDLFTKIYGDTKIGKSIAYEHDFIFQTCAYMNGSMSGGRTFFYGKKVTHKPDNADIYNNQLPYIGN